MRFAGIVLSLQNERINKAQLSKKGDYLILCLGESTTARGGVDSWPYQLEDILRQEGIGVKVINAGVEGITTDSIVANLPEQMNRYRPNLVVSMIGINDWVGTVTYKNNIKTRVSLFLRNLRIFKLTRTIYFNLSSKFHSLSNHLEPPVTDSYINIGRRLASQDKHEQAEEFFNRAIELNLGDGSVYHNLAISYARQGKIKDAFLVLNKYIENYGYNEGVYVDLGDFYMAINQHKKAEEMYKKAIEFDSKYEPAYTGLGLCYALQSKHQENYVLVQKIAQEKIKNDRLYGFIATVYNQKGEYNKARQYYLKAEAFRSQFYNPETKSNYLFLKDLVNQRGIKLVCMQYPLRDISSIKRMFESTHGIIFVENKNNFEDALKKKKYEDFFTDNFGGEFGHCTREGNRLIAEGLARKLKEEVFNKFDGKASVICE